MPITTRNRLTSKANQENPAGANAKAVQQKQNVANGLGARRPLAQRTALGDIRNRTANTAAGAGKLPLKKPLAEQKSYAGGLLRTKSSGYGASCQTRLTEESAAPLRRVISEESECGAAVAPSRPVTRALARKSAEAAEVVEALRPTPEEALAVKIDSEEGQLPPSAVSADAAPLKDDAAYSTAMIPKIDEGDGDNPQLVSTYVADIYEYLCYLEKQQTVRENYLEGNVVTGRMRAILVDWLAQVHIRFHLLPETMYMTIMIVDRFLQDVRIDKQQLQLLGVSSMFIASKYEEMYAPEIGDFVYITDNSYSKRDIRLMEITILQSLKFDIGRPLPIHFLRRFSKAADADSVIHGLGKYFMELSMCEYSMCHFAPSFLAAASLWLSLRLLNDGEVWSPTLRHYTRYTEQELGTGIRRLCRLLLKTHQGKSKQQAIRNKFATTKYGEVSNHDALSTGRVKAVHDSLCTGLPASEQ